MRRSNIRFFAVAALAALALAACSSSSKGASPATSPTTTTPSSAAGTTTSGPATNAATTVSLAASLKLGKSIIVDSKGMTLYVDENDKPGKPACTGGCLTIWPPVAAPASVTVGTGLTASMFSSVTLSDGTKQLTVNGNPLYTFMSDTTAASGGKAGDVKGQDVGGFYAVLATGKKWDPGASSGS